ncbi:MAG: DUF2207 domain-containing protein [Clostridia bacterium]|nr:DUF2207 domain-containing protein [Clostridia bacterium]
MIVLVLINILIIIYIFFEYYKPKEELKSINRDIKDTDVAIIGYINDQGVSNNLDLLIAEIIELNIKGYIKIEYEKTGLGKYNYTIKQNVDISSNELKNYEIVVLNFLFPREMEIKKIELEAKLKDTARMYNIQFKEMEKALNKEIIKQGIINEEKQKMIEKNTKIHIRISIIVIILLIILYLLHIINEPIYLLIYILEKLIITALLIKTNAYTDKGQILKYNIIDYQNTNKNQEFLFDGSKIEDIVLSKKFAISIALHINTDAKRTFIGYDITKKATKMVKIALLSVILAFLMMLLIGGIIAKITVEMTPIGRIVMYILFAIIVAFVTDISYMLAQKKR